MIQRIKSSGFLFLTILCLAGFSLPASAQHQSAAEEREFAKREDSLKKYADSIVNAEHGSTRLRADSLFVRSLVRSLKLPNSFYFPFDSLETISRLYAPDSSFRIFTWQYKNDEYIYLQSGCIQMRTTDGSLKLYPLFDVSMFTE